MILLVLFVFAAAVPLVWSRRGIGHCTPVDLRSGLSDLQRRRTSERRLILVAALIAVSIGLLLALKPSSDLDLDVLFPEPGDASKVGEATLVRWILLVLAAVVAVPLVVPRRLFRSVLAASTALIALFVAVSILRLGLLYVPVLAFQIRASWILYRRGHPGVSR